jgi:tryptophan-rich sensory protein
MHHAIFLDFQRILNAIHRVGDATFSVTLLFREFHPISPSASVLLFFTLLLSNDIFSFDAQARYMWTTQRIIN